MFTNYIFRKFDLTFYEHRKVNKKQKKGQNNTDKIFMVFQYLKIP